MSVSINKLADKLKELTAWQRTPVPLTKDDYVSMTIGGIKRLYIDTGRASAFSDTMLIKTEDDILLDAEIPIDEESYVYLVAQIEFFRRIQTDVNNVVSYSTDALSITNADKPYAHLQDTITNLENDRRVVYYKMTRYCLLS